jgi:hypothetical protein
MIGLEAVNVSFLPQWERLQLPVIIHESNDSTSRENAMLFCSVFHYVREFLALGESRNGSTGSPRCGLGVTVFPKKGLVEQFRSVPEIELILDSRTVGFDGLHIQTKFFGDFLGA